MKAESPSTSPNHAPKVHNKQKKLTSDQKIEKAEELLDKIILAKHNEYGADVIEPMIEEALSLLSKVKGQPELSAALHLQKGFLFGEKSSHTDVTKKQKEKLLKESFKEIGLAHKVNPGNLLAEYVDVKCKTYTIKKEQKREDARKAGWQKLLDKNPTTFDDNLAQSLALENTSGTEDTLGFLESLKSLSSFAGDYRLHITLAKTYEESGDLVKAEEAYREAVLANSKYVAGWSNICNVCLDQAELLEANGNTSEALAKKQEAKEAALNAYKSCKAQDMPLNQYVMTAVGCALLALGEPEEAVAIARQEMELFGENIDTWFSMAIALNNVQHESRDAEVLDMEEAIGYLDKILAQEPNNLLAIAKKVNASGCIGRIDEALECVGKLRKLLQKNKVAKAKYEDLPESDKEFVDAMLTDTNKELMQMLHGDILEIDEALTNPATKLLLVKLQEERDGLKSTKEKVQEVVFNKNKADGADEDIYGTAQQYAKDKAAFNKKAKSETKAAKAQAKDVDAQVEQLMKTDPKGYDFYHAYTSVVTSMYTTAMGSMGKLKLDTDSAFLGTFAELAGFMPLGGGLVTRLVEEGFSAVKEAGLNDQLSKLALIADPKTFQNFLTKIGLEVTKAKKDTIDDATPEVHSKIVGFLKKVAAHFKTDCQDKFLKNPQMKLGGVEASKFLKAVFKEEIPTDPKASFVERMLDHVVDHSKTSPVEVADTFCAVAIEALGVASAHTVDA